MASFNSMIGGPVLIAQTISTAAAIGTTTAPAPTGTGAAVRNTVYVYGIRISGTVAPAALVAVLLKDGSTTVMTIQVPAAWTGEAIDLPFPANHPYVAAAGNDVTLVIPSLGGTAISTGQIFYQIGPV